MHQTVQNTDCRIETSFSYKDANILQITAVCVSDNFDQYIISSPHVLVHVLASAWQQKGMFCVIIIYQKHISFECCYTNEVFKGTSTGKR